MNISIELIISILAIVFTIIGFVFSRKDKSNSDAENESYKWGSIDERLKSIEKALTKIEIKLDSYDTELSDKIEKAIKKHEEIYHKKGD